MAEMASLLCAWARESLPDFVTAGSSLRATPIAGDAGFRYYYRLDTAPSLIAVYAPPERENNPAFVIKGEALRRAGVYVPTVYAVDYERGFMLLEDLGDQLFLPLLNTGSQAVLYTAAERTLSAIQRIRPAAEIFPRYDERLLLDELVLFPDWFVEQLLGLRLDSAERRMLSDVFDILRDSALAQPQVVVHRDYHSRNLLWMPDDVVGVIDFQDAVVGPFSYDLVSLLKDCYIRWPVSLVRSRALDYLRRAWSVDRPGQAVADDGTLLAWFDLMGLQRHLKVLGIFARLWLRDGKARYLDDLPLVLRYTLEVTQHYKEFAQLNQWLGDRLLPAVETQPWYRPWQQAGD